MLEKMKMESVDGVQQNIDKIAELFPNCITEALDEEKSIIEKKVYKKVVNFELLKQQLSNEIVDGQEAYELNWVGKKGSIIDANQPIRKTLRPLEPIDKKSIDWDRTKNLYIEGDNLEVLKLLQESYLNKIKMIYIDPPYNTGNDAFIYNDNFDMTDDEFDQVSNLLDDNDNVKFKVNDRSNAKFHSKWCSMIYSRLLLARNLLSDDGVIFISIDDNELKNLISIANEIFGEENYINTISLFTKVSAGASGGGEDKRLKKNMEYILFYAKNANILGPLPTVYKKRELMDYIDSMKKEGKSFKYTNVLTKCDKKEYFTTIKDGSGGNIDIYKVNEYEIKTVNQLAKEENSSLEKIYNKYFNQIMTTTNAQTSIRTRVWDATDSENNMYIASYIPNSGKNKGKKIELIFTGKQKVLVIWLKDTAEKDNDKIVKKEKIGTFWDGFSWINVTKEGNVRFENGKKPIALIEQLMDLVPNNDDMIVMDFFSGSSSTAHAVLDYNFKNDKNISYIMIQLDEQIDEKNKSLKDYIKYLDEEKIEHRVPAIAQERIKRAGEKLESEYGMFSCDKDIGFRLFKVDSSNMKDVYYSANEYSQDLVSMMESNIKEDRTDLDLLFGCLLEWGLPLSLPYSSEKIDGINVHTYNDGDLIACFDENVSEDVIKEIAKRQPLRAVFRDLSFKDSASKINVEEIFKLMSPITKVKVI